MYASAGGGGNVTYEEFFGRVAPYGGQKRPRARMPEPLDSGKGNDSESAEMHLSDESLS